jgi:ASC-1-like (ASCH) protein
MIQKVCNTGYLIRRNNMKYDMKLNNDPFEKIKSGEKTIELRLNDEKRQLLKVNDIIEFTNRDTGEKLRTLIINLHYFDSFKELYNHFDKTMLGYSKNEEWSYMDMEEYYSIEEQKKYGVVGIEIKKL